MGFWRRAVVVVALAALLSGPVGAVFRSSPPADAQGGLAPAVAAACGPGALVCIAAVTLGMTWYIYSGGDGGELINLVDSFVSWFNGGSQGADQMTTQLGLHPTWAEMTSQMYTEWQLLLGVSMGGWTEQPDWEGLGDTAWTVTVGAPGNPAQIILESTEFTWPVGASACFITFIDYKWPQHPSGVSGVNKAYFAWNSGANERVLSSWGSGYTSPRWVSQVKQSLGGAGCDVVGQTGVLRLEFPGGTGTYEDGWIGVNELVLVVGTDPITGGDPDVRINVWISAFVSTELVEPAGERVKVIDTVDDLETWDGTAPLPLADGTEGDVVVAAAAAGTDSLSDEDKAWWETWLGSIAGLLGDIVDAVINIFIEFPTAVFDSILAAIQAIPGQIETALTNVFVPTQSVTARVTATSALAAGKAPFAWPSQIFVGVPLLFAGSGAVCPEITIPMPAGWGGDVVLEFCPPAGGAAVLLVMSRLIVLGIVAVWAYWLYRRLVGAES